MLGVVRAIHQRHSAMLGRIANRLHDPAIEETKVARHHQDSEDAGDDGVTEKLHLISPLAMIPLNLTLTLNLNL